MYDLNEKANEIKNETVTEETTETTTNKLWAGMKHVNVVAITEYKKNDSLRGYFVTFATKDKIMPSGLTGQNGNVIMYLSNLVSTMAFVYGTDKVDCTKSPLEILKAWTDYRSVFFAVKSTFNSRGLRLYNEIDWKETKERIERGE